jgi:Tol biopolymer transport system component
MKRFGLSGFDMPVDAFTSLAISPNGDRLVLRNRDEDGTIQLSIRELRSLEMTPIIGSEGGFLPFFSPDGSQVGFFARDEIRAASVIGGNARKVGVSAVGFSGGAWMPDGTIIFAGSSGRQLYEVPSTGGVPKPLQIDLPDDVHWIASPSPLPGNDAPFAMIADFFARSISQSLSYAIATDGTLAFISPKVATDSSALMRVDSSGRSESILTVDRVIDMPRISPDGKRIAYRTPAQNCDIWIHDIALGSTTRLTRFGDNHGIVWTSDGRHIITFTQGGPIDERFGGRVGRTVMLRADGVGNPEPLHDYMASNSFVISAGPNERLILLSTQQQYGAAGRFDLLDRETGAIRALLDSRFSVIGNISPDGQWIAYASDESGHSEIYIQPFPSLETRSQVSAGGGSEAVWSRDSRTLYFRRGNSFFSVKVETMPTLVTSHPIEVLANIPLRHGAYGIAAYDVDADGRFLVVRRLEQKTKGPNVEVLLNWFSEIRRLDPIATGR